MKRRRIICLLCCLALTAAVPIDLIAARIEGVNFRDHHQIGKTRLVLNNVALMRYQVVVKALVAGLYLGEGVKPEETLEDVPKRLEIHYFWSLAAKDIVNASNKLLEQNVSASRLESVRDKIDQMNALYENVKAGDTYTLTYIPGVGTELALNGKRKGIVSGVDFAEAYFSIWFGKRPMDIAMRDELLKKRT